MSTIGTRVRWDGGLQLGTSATSNYDPPIDPGPTATAPGAAVIRAVIVDDSFTDGARSVPTIRTVSRPLTRYRILVGGRDVTYFRGVRTPFPTYSLIEPLLYGSGSLSFPQINAALERPGHGDLSWLKKFSKVRVQRLGDDGHPVEGGARDFVGFISDFPPSGRDFTCTLGGEASGIGAMQDRPLPIFSRVNDIGGWVMRTIQHALRLPVANSPTTGIRLPESGGGSQLDWLTEILAKSTQLDGQQWTVAPNSSGVYHMHLKDLTTIDATVYIDGFMVAESLKRDFTEEPNRVWAEGIDPDGMRVNFATLPGLASSNARPSFPGTLSPGDSGDGVVALIWRLYTVGYLDSIPFGATWTTAGDDPVTDGVKDLQDDAGLPQTGVVNAATWAKVFDPDVTGYSTARAARKPAAQRSYTQPFLRNASGQIAGRNPAYDRSRPVVDVSLDMGAGFTRQQIRKWAFHELADDNTANWVGTIVVNGGAVIDGEHNPGDSLDSSGLRDVRTIKPGMNLWLPNWDGGTLVHVSGVNMQPGTAEFTVDTRARDTMKVWEVIARNRESRKNPSRQWIAQNRRSGVQTNGGEYYDGSVFGRVERTFLAGGQWTVVPTPAGRSGTIQKVDMSVRDDASTFVVAAFGHKVTPTRLTNMIGDPTTKAGCKNWKHKNKLLTDTFWLAWAFGGVDDYGTEQLAGYYPETIDPTAYDSHTQRGGSADAATDVIHMTGHGYSNGTEVYFTGTVPDGLTPNNNYYVVSAATDSFKVSASPGGSAVGISADATGVAVQTRTKAFPPVTGDFSDHAGVPYFCKGQPVLWLAFYPTHDCYLQGGRVLELLLDDASV